MSKLRQTLQRVLTVGLPAIAFPTAIALATVVATAGCKSAISVSGSFATPAETVSGTVQATTNAVTVGGNYQTGTTNIGGTVTVGK